MYYFVTVYMPGYKTNHGFIYDYGFFFLIVQRWSGRRLNDESYLNHALVHWCLVHVFCSAQRGSMTGFS